jgi:MarR family 2-MHQ and catechol resistance regulon transcriptional repressor
MKKKQTAIKTYLKLLRAAESIRARVFAKMSEFNLSESQIGVLEALFSLGPLNQKQLATKLLKSGGNITMVVDNLEKMGLVIRKRGKPDRRFFTIHLTENGKEKIKEIFPVFANAISEEMKILSGSEQAELQKLTKAVGLQRR